MTLLEKGTRIEGVKSFTLSEDYLADPDNGLSFYYRFFLFSFTQLRKAPFMIKPDLDMPDDALTVARQLAELAEDEGDLALARTALAEVLARLARGAAQVETLQARIVQEKRLEMFQELEDVHVRLGTNQPTFLQAR